MLYAALQSVRNDFFYDLNKFSFSTTCKSSFYIIQGDCECILMQVKYTCNIRNIRLDHNSIVQ